MSPTGTRLRRSVLVVLVIGAGVAVLGAVVWGAVGPSLTQGGDAGTGTSPPAEGTYVVVRYPTDDGFANETLASSADVRRVSDPVESSGNVYTVGVRLTPDAGDTFGTRLDELGLDDPRRCHWDSDRRGYCLLIVEDGTVLDAANVGPGLADRVRRDPTFVLAFENESTARRVARALGSGDATDR